MGLQMDFFSFFFSFYFFSLGVGGRGEGGAGRGEGGGGGYSTVDRGSCTEYVLLFILDLSKMTGLF